MSLSNLPPELLHLICRQFPSGADEQFTLRKVCRVFADIAAEHIVDQIEIHCARDRLNNVVDFMETHPRIAKGVSELIFHTDRLDHFATYDEWYQQRRVSFGCELRSEFELPFDQLRTLREGTAPPRKLREIARQQAKAEAAYRGSFTKPQLKKAWHRYQEIYDEQLLLLEGNGLFEWLLRLFKACPKIRWLALNSGDNYFYNTCDYVRSYQEAMAFPLEDSPNEVCLYECSSSEDLADS